MFLKGQRRGGGRGRGRRWGGRGQGRRWQDQKSLSRLDQTQDWEHSQSDLYQLSSFSQSTI